MLTHMTIMMPVQSLKMVRETGMLGLGYRKFSPTLYEKQSIPLALVGFALRKAIAVFCFYLSPVILYPIYLRETYRQTSWSLALFTLHIWNQGLKVSLAHYFMFHIRSLLTISLVIFIFLYTVWRPYICKRWLEQLKQKEKKGGVGWFQTYP